MERRNGTETGKGKGTVMGIKKKWMAGDTKMRVKMKGWAKVYGGMDYEVL